MEEVAKALSDIPAINRFLSYCRIRTVPSKTVIIHAGDLPDILYYIISGSVEVMIEDEDGNEMVLAYLNKGQFFGEMGLFYEQPTPQRLGAHPQQLRARGNDLSALPPDRRREPGPDFRIGHAARHAPRSHQPQTRRSRLRRRHRPRRACDHGPVRRAGCDDAPGRHADQGSRQELSRLVGCSREMAGRVLKVLEEQGLLRATGKTIVVFNARPKMKTRPVIVPVKPGSAAPVAAKSSRAAKPSDEDDEDEDEENYE